MTTLEEVQRCPQCDFPGEVTRHGHLSGTERRSYSLIFFCRNKRCRWYDTSWIVQVRADGTFPPALRKRPKQFPKMDTYGSVDAMRNLVDIYEASLREGAEIR